MKLVYQIYLPVITHQIDINYPVRKKTYMLQTTRLNVVNFMSTTFCILLDCIVGICGFWIFDNRVKSNILEDLDDSEIDTSVIPILV